MKNNSREFWVGLFAGLGFLILTVFIFFVGGISIFKHGYIVTLKFDYVSILDKGAPVRMAGVRVGEVKDVALVFDDKARKNRVYVKTFLNRGIEVRENYVFTISGTHVLSEPHIEITPQPGVQPLLKNGAVLEGVGPVQIDDLITRAQHISAELDGILTRVRSMTDDEELTSSLKTMVVNFSQISEKMNAFMSDNKGDMTATLQDLRGFAASLNNSGTKFNDIVNRVNKGEGTVGKLLVDEKLYNDMNEFVADIKKNPWKLLKRDKKFILF